MWTTCFGHGHETFLSDEKVVRADETNRLRNGNMRGMFCSFSCSNGAFNYPFEQSMCKQFLFAPKGGYIGYIVATTVSYAGSNTNLAQVLFTNRDSLNALSFGRMFMNALYNNDWNYNFLGDPALRPYPKHDTLGYQISENYVLCEAGAMVVGSHYGYQWIKSEIVHPMGDINRSY